MAKYVMALDAGTTSNRCILFDEKGRICSVAQKEFTQYFPQPGWVEHDADEIWSTQLGVAVEAMSKIGAEASDIADIQDKVPSGGIVSLVDIDFDEYRRKNEQRAVKKNCTIPSWLNEKAEAAGVNFSAVLQDALKARLHLDGR